MACRKSVADRQEDRLRKADYFSNIFRLEKKIVLQFPSRVAPASILDAILLRNGMICVLTSGAKNGAYFFDVDGVFKKEIKPRDRFIREFGQPWQVESDADENISILDLRRHKIFVFNSDGEYQRIIDAPKTASSFKISSANNYFFNSPVSTDETTILVADKNGSPIRSFSLMPPNIQEILYYKTIVPDRPLVTLNTAGEIFQGFPITNTINKFNSDLHFVGSFQHALRRYNAPDVAAWKNAVKSSNREKEFNRLLSQTTLFTGLYCLTPKVIMAEFMNIADYHPRYLSFFTTDGEYINGEINFDKDEFGKLLRAENERLFSCRIEKVGRTSQYNLYVFLIPRL